VNGIAALIATNHASVACGKLGRTALGAYVVRRFGVMLGTLIGISMLIFLLFRLTPGNIADILFDAGGFVDPADKARIEADLGLDRSLPVQYFQLVSGLLQRDLGSAYQ